jgi:isopentenyl-diphosphate delta-isomerase
MISQEVILVDEHDRQVGLMEKMQAHREGLLHRAFSVFIFDRAGRMLLQQRAGDKYHGGHLWTNACCSHPFPGEGNEEAAVRRLREELGFTTKLEEIFSFTYRAEVENGLTEHEFDHVFAGTWDGSPQPDPREVADWCYRETEQIEKDIVSNPENFTVWFRMAFPRISEWKMKRNSKK